MTREANRALLVAFLRHLQGVPVGPRTQAYEDRTIDAFLASREPAPPVDETGDYLRSMVVEWAMRWNAGSPTSAEEILRSYCWNLRQHLDKGSAPPATEGRPYPCGARSWEEHEATKVCDCDGHWYCPSCDRKADAPSATEQRYWRVFEVAGGGGWYPANVNAAGEVCIVEMGSMRPTRAEAEADGRASGLPEWREE